MTLTTITAALVAIALCATVAYNLNGWDGPVIATGQTALPLGIPPYLGS